MAQFKNEMLKDPAVREQLKAEVCGIQWTMKIRSVNREKHYCFLGHEDFPDNVFCPEFRISGESPETGSDCEVTLEIAEHNGEYNFKAKSCRVLNRGTGGKIPGAKSPKPHPGPNEFRKNGAGNRPFSPGRGPAGSSATEDFYRSREEFFKACRMGSDEGVFAIYLNRAVTNFCLQTDGAIPPQNDFKPGKFRKKIEELSPAVQKKLAHFLFQFAVVEPAGYADKENPEKPWNTICADCGELLVSLRNFFSHTDRELQNELHLKDSFYRFLGKLNGEAASSVKQDSHALANFPLFRRIVRKEQGKFMSYQELTRHGIAFVCCMALFKDEADHFCSQLAGLRKHDMFSDSMREYFTRTSFPPHRQLLEQKTPEVLMFADMINYLNKVPSVCFQNLSLQSERKRLDELKNLSNESEENKKSRFLLHERIGDKFASYALSYLTDFNILPHFTFRHLDTSSAIDRQRYSYEQFSADTLPLDRHFIVDHDSVQFEWKLPEDQPHSGKIHIKALRGMMTDRMLQEILYLALDPAGMNLPVSIDQQLHQWFTAYHAFLEKVLDRAAGRVPLEAADFLPELQIISGKSGEEICRNFADSAGNIIGPGLAAFFNGQNQPGEEDRMAALIAKVNASLEHDLELEKRFHKEKLSDALMIRQVFRFFNLQLENTRWQFRQLPLSEQHRGCLDYEYQTVHAMIGKYTAAPKELWKHFRKMSEKMKLKKEGAAFCSTAGLSPEDACSYCSSRADLLEQSKVLKRTASLEELSFAALRECIRESRNVLKKLTSPEAEKPTAEELACWTARYGLKQEKKYDSDDLFRTVLKINRADWQNAFDYKTNSSWKNRPLESSEFIVPQINLPQDFFRDMLSLPEILAKLEKNPRSPWNPETGKIDFLRGIRLVSPPIRLRDYYDDSTLVQWLKDNSGEQTTMPVCPDRKNNVAKAYKNIRKVFARDKLLILAALQYWNKYCRYETRLKFAGEEEKQPADVYDFFSRDIVYSAASQKIRIRLNDLNKLSFSQLTGSREIIRAVCENLSLPADVIPDFDTLRREMTRVKDSDTRIQRRFIIPVLKFYDHAGDVPAFQRPPEMSDQEWNDVLPRKIAEALHHKGYGTQLSVDEIVLLMDFRNALVHDKFNLEKKFSPAERIEPLLLKMEVPAAHKQ